MAWTRKRLLQRYLIDAGVEFFVQGTPNRAVAGLITISGVLFASMLTGFVVDGVKEQLEGVRRGRQAVIEFDHTLLIVSLRRIAVPIVSQP